MSRKSSIAIALLCLLAGGAAVAAPSVVAASGRWAALREKSHCEAASLALLPATKARAQGRVSLGFDRRGRRGQAAVFLSRPARAGSSAIMTIGDTPFLLVGRGQWAWSRGAEQEAAIVAAMRDAAHLRVEARSDRGVRFIDRYELAGAPTAIDAAAACAATLVNP